jgi:hypothetical protein
MRGHARLRDSRHFYQIGDAQLAFPQQGAEPNSVLVCEQVQRFDVVGEVHVSRYLDGRIGLPRSRPRVKRRSAARAFPLLWR